MGKQNRAKKFAAKKRVLNPKDSRIKSNQSKLKEKEQKKNNDLKDKVNQDLQIKEM
jgi:hypothetical protein